MSEKKLVAEVQLFLSVTRYTARAFSLWLCQSFAGSSGSKLRKDNYLGTRLALARPIVRTIYRSSECSPKTSRLWWTAMSDRKRAKNNLVSSWSAQQDLSLSPAFWARQPRLVLKQRLRTCNCKTCFSQGSVVGWPIISLRSTTNETCMIFAWSNRLMAGKNQSLPFF